MRHGWYLASDAREHGFSIYKHDDGSTVKVTNVDSNRDCPYSNIEGVEYVGVVVKFLSAHGGNGHRGSD